MSEDRLLRATLKEVGATASLRVYIDSVLREMKISDRAHITQGLPTQSCPDEDLLKNSSRNRLRCHKDCIPKKYQFLGHKEIVTMKENS